MTHFQYRSENRLIALHPRPSSLTVDTTLHTSESARVQSNLIPAVAPSLTTTSSSSKSVSAMGSPANHLISADSSAKSNKFQHLVGEQEFLNAPLVSPAMSTTSTGFITSEQLGMNAKVHQAWSSAVAPAMSSVPSVQHYHQQPLDQESKNSTERGTGPWGGSILPIPTMLLDPLSQSAARSPLTLNQGVPPGLEHTGSSSPTWSTTTGVSPSLSAVGSQRLRTASVPSNVLPGGRRLPNGLSSPWNTELASPSSTIQPWWSPRTQTATEPIPRPRSGLDAAHHIPGFLTQDNDDEDTVPRQQRSMSFSVGSGSLLGGVTPNSPLFMQPQSSQEDDMTKAIQAFKSRLVSYSLPPSTLEVVPSEPSEDERSSDLLSPGKPRSRSKSSSALYALSNHAYPGSAPVSPVTEEVGNLSEMDAIAVGFASPSNNPDLWTAPTKQPQRIQPSLYHRRASTQPTSGLLWEAANRSPITDPVVENGEVMMNEEQLERYRAQRKFSHAPTIVGEYSQRLMLNRGSANMPMVPESSYDMGLRRHSLGGPNLDTRHVATHKLAKDMAGLQLNNNPTVTNGAAPALSDINEYFENKANRAKAWAEAGKNLQTHAAMAAAAAVANLNHALSTGELDNMGAPVAHSSSAASNASAPGGSGFNWPLYVVEFKAGRTDFFYITEDLECQGIKMGDLVIVEADRGKDLGKVIEANVRSMEQVLFYQKQLAQVLPELYNSNKAVVPKRLFRRAEAGEVSMLFSKSQDEAKAMALCQTKIRQRNLPMEVVDAEYQWDRRKLTFYFVADRRIDFRELVRELFKIYKTRIWMCAVNANAAIIQ